MKNKNLLKLRLLLITLFLSFYVTNGQVTSSGDIAFTGFNSDGDDDFSIVNLVDILPNTVIFFKDGSGFIQWNTGNFTIPSGSITIFTDVDSTTNNLLGVSTGTIQKTGTFNWANGGELVLVYLGIDKDTPSTYLTGLKNASLTISELDGTGLIAGTNFIELNKTAHPDAGFFNGSRSSQSSFNNYKSFLFSNDNWTTNDNGESLLPFSEESFTINSTNWTGATNSDWNLSGNWDNGIPTSSFFVTIPNVTTAPIISTNATVGNLTITEPDGVKINSGASLIVNGISTGNVTYQRNLTTTNWFLVSSPVAGETMTSMRANNSFANGTNTNIGFATYNNSQTLAANKWSYFTNTATDALMNGAGYSTKLTSIGNISFKGTLNTSDNPFTLIQNALNGGDDFNLLGNPYATFINLNTFLTNESADLKFIQIWVWNQSLGINGEYETKNLASNFKIAPTQGFFVEAASSNSIVFRKGMQSHEGVDTFQKTSTLRPEITIKLSDGNHISKSYIYYIEGSTTGFDNGYDGKKFGGVTYPFSVYSHLVSDSSGLDFDIQSLPNSDFETMTIPVGITAAAGKEITFTAEAMNLPADLKVFLEDKVSNTITRLDEANSSYKVTLNDALNGIGRFYLHTKANSVLSTTDVSLENVSVYSTGKNTLRVVGLSQGKASLKLFNILGKQVFASSFNANGVQDLNLPTLSTGIYVVQLETENGKLNKKITLE